jgi:succinate dehydrogenase / fumarate reductase cytochrome b subunit
MDSAPPTRPKQLRRPKYYDLNLARLPPPGLVSIIHRVTGALLFFPILPVLLYALATTLGSEEGYNRWHDLFMRPVVKLLLVGAVWLYAHHFFAGIRYLLLDLHIGIAKAPSRTSALAVLALGVITAAIAAWCLW